MTQTGPTEESGVHAWMLAALSALLSTSACTHNVRLLFPDSSPGEEYTCLATTQGETCQPATVISPQNNNQANTAFVILPKECKGSYNDITIHDSGSSTPSVDVKCAPLENKIK
jgi:hypothetical protein